MSVESQNHILAETLKKALDIWVSLSGVDPHQRTFKMRIGGLSSEHDVVTYHRIIAEALELDDTNITGYLMLDALSSSYFQGRTFSVEDLLSEDLNVAQYLTLTREFKALMNNPDIKVLGDEFSATIKLAVEHYNAATATVLEKIEDRHLLAFLRRDALRSIKNLRVDQFLVGEPENEGVKPAYVEKVHRFWNMNSLIAAACKQPSGISLNLIMDPMEYHSYFAFAIRNGGNLFILSDAPKEAHPLRKFMSRRPDREFDIREAQNHFPYDLLGIKYIPQTDEFGNIDGYHTIIDRSDEKGIIPLRQEFDPLKSLQELAPNEIIWIAMMFDLILDKFWKQGFQAKELSYTGAMIHEDHSLMVSAASANLPVAKYEGINVAPLVNADLHSDALSSEAIGNKNGDRNRWMEDRYGEQVSDIAVNLLSVPGVLHYLEPAIGSSNHDSHQNHEKALVLGDQVVRVPEHYESKFLTLSSRTNSRYTLHAVDGSNFGTKEELVNDRLFIARHNYAKGIQKLADEEFFRRKDEVITWWKNAVEANKERIIAMCVNDKLWLSCGDRSTGNEFFGTVSNDGRYLLMKRHTVEELKDNYRISSGMTNESSANISGVWDINKNQHRCCITDSICSYKSFFRPQNREALALLAGCEVNDLPDVLQHWSASSNSPGNSRLYRIDPLSWALRNPWEALKFPVLVALSKRGMAKIEAQYPKISENAEPQSASFILKI
jgi:hypothetical protein